MVPPADYEFAYYSREYNYFGEYAASLIIESDDSYRIIGRDQKMIEYLDNELKFGVNKLSYTYGEFNEKTGDHYLCYKWINLTGELFWAALCQRINYIESNKYDYEIRPLDRDDFVKVNSLFEAKELVKEYEKSSEQSMQEALAKWTQKDWDKFYQLEERERKIEEARIKRQAEKKRDEK